LIATYPAAGQGLDCPQLDPACGVDRNVAIQLRFDRYLLPATAVRQSIRVFTGTGQSAPFTRPDYDVVERVLSYRPDGHLVPGQTYRVELVLAEDESSEGLRAFDGALLGEGPVPLAFDFRTNEIDPPPASPVPREEATCDDVLAITARSTGCSGNDCHIRRDDSFSVPRMGLELVDAYGLLTTAIGKVAHQTEIGGKTGVPLQNPARFGVQMPIIDPGRPDNSYLLYKLIRKPENFDTTDAAEIEGLCQTRYQFGILPGDPCVPPPEDESTRLREWFVRNEPMPLGPRRITRHELRRIQAWIVGGAKCP
jgi:hypothetical protein